MLQFGKDQGNIEEGTDGQRSMEPPQKPVPEQKRILAQAGERFGEDKATWGPYRPVRVKGQFGSGLPQPLNHVARDQYRRDQRQADAIVEHAVQSLGLKNVAAIGSHDDAHKGQKAADIGDEREPQVGSADDVAIGVMSHSINGRGQKEYDKTPEDHKVHHPGVGIAKKASVGQDIHHHGADENRYSPAHVSEAVLRPPQTP